MASRTRTVTLRGNAARWFPGTLTARQGARTERSFAALVQNAPDESAIHTPPADFRDRQRRGQNHRDDRTDGCVARAWDAGRRFQMRPRLSRPDVSSARRGRFLTQSRWLDD